MTVDEVTLQVLQLESIGKVGRLAIRIMRMKKKNGPSTKNDNPLAVFLLTFAIIMRCGQL